MSLDKLRELLNGFRTTQMIIVAARAGIADALVHGPRSIEDLAASAKVHAPSLYRVLRGLASLGIFKELPGRHFELTPLAEGLRSDLPGSMHAAAILFAEPAWWEVWGHMFDTMKSGKPAFNTVRGMELFEYLDRHPQVAERFNAHMAAVTEVDARDIVTAYDFSQAGRVVDVGGGHGILLCEILRAYPSINGALYDQPAVIAGAQPRLQRAGVADRCALLGGDFFAAVPEGFDTYILKNIIHDWDDARATQLLRNCRRAMNDTGRLLLMEHIITEDNEPNTGKLLDITMLVITGGPERTLAEHEALLRTAGFRIHGVTPVAGGSSVIDARPV